MESEKKVYNLPYGCTEMIVREGKAQNILDIKPPVQTHLKGVISSPYNYLVSRVGKGQFEVDRCHVVVNREKVSINLIINDNDEYLKGDVYGELTINPKYKEFGINNEEKRWYPNDLGQFLKMNRYYFPDKAEGMALVATLKNFSGTATAQYDKENGDGKFKDNFSAYVSSNVPKFFVLKIPIFKDASPVEIEVEFCPSTNNSTREIYFQLYSPAAAELFEQVRDSAIDDQLELIKIVAPGIAIIEV